MGEPGHAFVSVGDVFHGKYEVRRCLKVGGMAIVYEVVHRVTRRPSALKVMLSDILSERGMKARFEQEARITAGIESDHIVEVLDAGVDDATGSPFLVMELLRGDDLEAVLRRRGKLPGEEVVALLSQAALALDAVHAANIVHRDLKPSNLFVVEAPAQPRRLKLLDFGIAKIVADSALTTRNFGTPVYMSPEQADGAGDIGPAADRYAVGHIAYTLLVGAPYWDEERAAGGRVLFDKLEEGATDPATRRARSRNVQLPEAFDAWFARATAVDPEARFGTASDMIDSLALSLGVPHTADPVELPRRPRRTGRSPVLWLIAAGAVGGACWAGVRAVAGTGQGPDAPATEGESERPPRAPREVTPTVPASDGASSAAAETPPKPPREAAGAAPVASERPARSPPPPLAVPRGAPPAPGAAKPSATPLAPSVAVSPSPFGTAVY